MKTLWKIVKYLIAVGLSLVFASLLLLGFFSFYHPQIEHADAAVILGAAINTPAIYNRTLTGLKLYQDGKVPVLVLSGGRISDKDISEAGYMLKVLRYAASTTPPFLMDEQSHSTFDNLKDARALIPGAKSLVVVSDRFHLARAALLARRDGFETVYWDSPDPSYYSKPQLAYYYFREVFAIIDYIPKFIFG